MIAAGQGWDKENVKLMRVWSSHELRHDLNFISSNSYISGGAGAAPAGIWTQNYKILNSS